MSVSDSRARELAVLRRIRSAGDLPASAQASTSRASGSAAPPHEVYSAFQPSPSPIPPLTLPSNFPTTIPPQLATEQRQAAQSAYRRTLAFFGIGRGVSHARKAHVSLVWNLCWGFAQVVVIVTLLALIGTSYRSPTHPGLSEWKACDRPLGIWGCLWVVRVVFASGLAYWEFVRDQALHRQRPDGEAAGDNVQATQPHNGSSPVQHVAPYDAHAATINPTDNSTAMTQPQEHIVLPYTHLYSRLTLFSSIMTLSWFLTAHILEYTSLNTCRYSSPHLWWLTFGILCIMYLMVLEVILLGFVVLVVAPILFVFWNIFLICIGRHPLQNPHMIKPEIGKLPKSVVDRIPLVMYIPPPPSDFGNQKIPTYANNHAYPPNIPLSEPKKDAFRFLKKLSSFQGSKRETSTGTRPSISDEEKGKAAEEPETWEGHWEKGDYPFIVLEGNRAACAICLMDFEEPQRKITTESSQSLQQGTDELITQSANDAASPKASTAKEVVPTHPEGEGQKELGLMDAGEGAQPLRLLACGHVFHQTCLDPWLTDVSGRCPVCQRAVEVAELKKRKRRLP